MIDIVTPLGEAYFRTLKLTGEDVYNAQAPDRPINSYIVFEVQTINPVNLKSGFTVTVNVKVAIYTAQIKYNSGEDVNDMAGKIYQAILPTPDFKLDLGESCQMVSTDLSSDVPNNWKIKNQLVAIDRTITFSHKISIS